MKDILKSLDLKDDEAKPLNDKLKELRSYSDVAHIIGHPKNPAKGHFAEMPPASLKQLIYI